MAIMNKLVLKGILFKEDKPTRNQPQLNKQSWAAAAYEKIDNLLLPEYPEYLKQPPWSDEVTKTPQRPQWRHKTTQRTK
jgi:hypothetical protein